MASKIESVSFLQTNRMNLCFNYLYVLVMYIHVCIHRRSYEGVVIFIGTTT